MRLLSETTPLVFFITPLYTRAVMPQSSRGRPVYPRREYSDEEIAHALTVLKSNRGNVWRTSAELAIPYDTLRSWKQGRVKRVAKPHPDLARLHKEKELQLAAECEKVLWKILKYGLTPKKLREATASSAATAFGIFTDKMRILKDQGPPPSEAAKTAAEAIKQAAAALVELSKQTAEPIDLATAHARIRDLQLQSAQLASEQTQ